MSLVFGLLSENWLRKSEMFLDPFGLTISFINIIRGLSLPCCLIAIEADQVIYHY